MDLVDKFVTPTIHVERRILNRNKKTTTYKNIKQQQQHTTKIS